GLGDTPAVMVQADKELVTTGVLRQVDEAGVAVLQDIVDEFLDDAEDAELVFRLQAFPVLMETGAGVHAAGTADLLEKVVDGGFKREILQGGGHQRMTDIPDKLDGIVNDLFGIVDALQLGRLVKVDEVLVE